MLRAFIADVIISEVHARQSPVDLPRKTKKNIMSRFEGGYRGGGRDDKLQ